MYLLLLILNLIYFSFFYLPFTTTLFTSTQLNFNMAKSFAKVVVQTKAATAAAASMQFYRHCARGLVAFSTHVKKCTVNC